MLESNRTDGRAALKWLATGYLQVWFFGAVAAVLFIGFVRGISYQKGVQTGDHRRAAAQAEREAAKPFETRCAGLSGEEVLRCLEAKIKATREAQITQQNLHAQQGMELWAFWVLLVTGGVGIGTILVTFVGVIYMWRTLEATADAAEAAHRAVRVSLDVGAQESRAWIKCKIVGQEDVGFSEDRTSMFANVTMLLENVGSRPAQNIRLDAAPFTAWGRNFPFDDFQRRADRNFSLNVGVQTPALFPGDRLQQTLKVTIPAPPDLPAPPEAVEMWVGAFVVYVAYPGAAEGLEARVYLAKPDDGRFSFGEAPTEHICR